MQIASTCEAQDSSVLPATHNIPEHVASCRSFSSTVRNEVECGKSGHTRGTVALPTAFRPVVGPRFFHGSTPNPAKRMTSLESSMNLGLLTI